jgi:hypothetical protein
MKLKYKFRVHALLDTYPTEEDALFDIYNFLSERSKVEEEWTDVGVRTAFSKKMEEDEINQLLDSLAAQGFISKRQGAGKRCYFKIIKNPFI